LDNKKKNLLSDDENYNDNDDETSKLKTISIDKLVILSYL
jgi:hypothetical protein